ncbi:MAG: hypothetical protein ACE5FG_08750 [Myxococcota bacterium]
MGKDQTAWISRLFYVGAVFNWLVTVGSILDPVASSELFGIEPPRYPFLLRIWAGMAFLFGCMFLDIARDPLGKRALIPYAWAEKAVSAVSVTVGAVWGHAPLVLLLMVVVTDWIWIPPFLAADCRLRRIAAERGPDAEGDQGTGVAGESGRGAATRRSG